MTDIMDVIKMNSKLSVGDRVEVRWTNSGLHFREPGTVTKVNECSARVAIDNDVRGDWSLHSADKVMYPAGHEITSPLCNMRTMLRWQWSNGIFEIQEDARAAA